MSIVGDDAFEKVMPMTDKGGTTVLKVGEQFHEQSERKHFFTPHFLPTREDMKQNIAHVSLL